MADLLSYMDIQIQLDYVTNKIKVTDVGSYPIGIANDVKGILSITQPDGVTIEGDFNTPDIEWDGSALSVGQRDLRRTSANLPQGGTYIVRYQIDHPGYTPSTITKTFILAYTPVTQSVTESLDIFTPQLVLQDATVYSVGGFTTSSTTRAWSVQVGTIGLKTGSGTTLDLAMSGQYYDAAYVGSLTTTVLYQHTTYSYLTVRDAVSIDIDTQTNTPPTCTEMLGYLTEIKDRFDQSAGLNCTVVASLKKDYEYAAVLFLHIKSRIIAGDTTSVYSYIQDFLNVYYNNRTVPYVNTNIAIPAYDTGDCGCSSGSGSSLTLFTPKEYLIGTTSGAPVAGATTFSHADFAGREVLIFIARSLQSKIDDGSGSYYSKTLASTTISLTGSTWETGTLVQIFDATGLGASPKFAPKEYLIGTTIGAPTDGTATFTHSDFANKNIMLFIARTPQSEVDDGSGSYFSKPLASDTITLSGQTWETGTLIQIFEV